MIRAVSPHRAGDAPDVASSTPPEAPCRVVHHAGTSGMVLAADLETLVREARRGDGIVELVPQVGDFVANEEPLSALYGRAAAIDDRKLRATVALRSERTMEQEAPGRARAALTVAPRNWDASEGLGLSLVHQRGSARRFPPPAKAAQLHQDVPRYARTSTAWPCTGPVNPRTAIVFLIGVAMTLAGCTSMAGGPAPPPGSPALRPGQCSPGWTMGSDGICQREPSNFGGRGTVFGHQAP